MVISPQRLLQHLQTLLASCHYPAKTRRTLWLAYSGGLDSHSLLHLVSALRDDLTDWNIQAIHINHSLQPAATQWAGHCQAVCQQLELPCRVVTLTIDTQGESIEAAARDARYRAFAECMQQGDVLLTAQHADDQAETLMLQMLRGSGPRGMAAMPATKKFAGGYLLRPLLGFRRRELELYAEQQQLAYIHDPSNDDSRFDRNFLRADVVPVLQQRWPSLVPTLLRSAQQQAEAAELLDVLAAQDMAQCMGSTADGLALAGLRGLAVSRQRNVLRYWLRQQAVTTPHRRKLNEILRTMLTAAEDRQPHIDWPGGEVRRYRGELYASSSALPQLPSAQPWDLQAELELPAGLGYLSASQGLGAGLDLGRLKSAPVSIRFRQGGENCLPAGRGQHHSLKKLFQESAIPPWQRERIPLLYIGEELAQIMGICICEPFKAAAGQPAVNIEWQQNCSSS